MAGQSTPDDFRQTASSLLQSLLTASGIGSQVTREAIRVWARSGVERLHLADGRTWVFKYAVAPFHREHIALRQAAEHGVPVPALIGAHSEPGLLGMLLEDLGEPIRDAQGEDAAEAAVTIHGVLHPGGLPILDRTALNLLPGRLAARSRRLGLPDSITATATSLARVADRLAEQAHLPPFGLCHGEFHPSSLHIGQKGWRLVDLARAFTGPGLLDLASWQGTIAAPDPEAAAALIDRYVAYGGHRGAVAPRAGLPSERWALGWHRMWIANWYAEQIDLGWAENEPGRWTDAISKHLEEASQLFAIQ